MDVRFGETEVSYSARGNRTYRVELWHDGLKKHRLIKGSEPEVVRRKAELQAQEWEGKWEETEKKDAAREAKAEKKQYQEDQKTFASEQTSEAQASLRNLEQTLEHTLSVDDAIDWEQLKDSSSFPEAKPGQPKVAKQPSAPEYPLEPSQNDPKFVAEIGLLDRLISSRRKTKEARTSALYQKAHNQWQEWTVSLKERHRKTLDKHALQLKKVERQFHKELKDWKSRRDTFLQAQSKANAGIDRQRVKYEEQEPEAIEEYCDLVLSRSKYPDWLPQEFELSYTDDNSTLLVAYSLPSVEVISTLREVSYIQSRDEFTEKQLSDVQIRKLYDSLLYQIVLRTVHELFESDRLNALDSIVFNGHVTSVDRSTGQTSTACILSLQAGREEFMKINLAQVDPKACFKALKGVGSSKLHSLTPIAPIMELRREDGRFISSR
jgi:restriction system protein